MDLKFRWIQTLSILLLILQLTAAGENSELVVRDGDEITLPCETVVDDLYDCESITWIFNGSRQGDEEQLVTFGQIPPHSKSDRLTVTPDCFLTVKTVTTEDVGQYICKQFLKFTEDVGPDSRVDLSVVSMTERRSTDTVTLRCSVLTPGPCRNTVRWMINGNIWGVTDTSATITQSSCSATAFFLVYHHVYKSNYTSLSCSVTNISGKEQIFSFYPESSSKETDWWRFIIVPVGLAALITVVVVVSVRTRGKPTQMDENTEFFK